MKNSQALGNFLGRFSGIVLVFLADRGSKFLVLRDLRPRGSIYLAPFFRLTYVENTGAAFGVGTRQNGFFILVTAILVAVFFRLQTVWRDKSAWARTGLVLVLGGALGNLYDRLLFGHVIDFLDFRVWPVFNVADSCITLGAFCLFWGLKA